MCMQTLRQKKAHRNRHTLVVCKGSTAAVHAVANRRMRVGASLMRATAGHSRPTYAHVHVCECDECVQRVRKGG